MLKSKKDLFWTAVIQYNYYPKWKIESEDIVADNDDKRSGEVFETARDQHLKICWGGKNPGGQDRQQMAFR